MKEDKNRVRFLGIDNISTCGDSISVSVEKVGEIKTFLPGARCNCGCNKTSLR